MNSLLLIEDSDSLCMALAQILEEEGFEVSSASTGEEGLQKLSEKNFSLILTDLKLPGISGLEVLAQSQREGPNTPVVIMTAHSSIDSAVNTMKLGATDFLSKPFSPDILLQIVSNIIKQEQIDISLSSSSEQHQKCISQNIQMEKLLLQARKVAPLSSSVLIFGESGTGKELLARHIHEQSSRSDKKFVPVNCASLPEQLLESEFFGHEAGAFTGATEARTGLFEHADGGTLFLDEIGNMPMNLQIKLLRALQESEIKPLGSNQTKKVNVRIIAATNCNLEAEMEKGAFREDLFYRLAVVIFEIPALRERTDDIQLLANYFVKSFAKKFQKENLALTKKALAALETYSWPGNVRELENVIEQAVIFADGPITKEMLLLNSGNAPEVGTKPLAEISQAAAREAEKDIILRTLQNTQGNKSAAARLLGVSYKTLLNKVKSYGLEDTP